MVWSTWKYEVEPALHSVSLQSKYYYRTGSTLQELKGDKLTRFIMKKQGEHWDAIAVNEVKPTDLSSKAFTLFKTKANHSKRLSGGDFNQTDIDLLEKLHLLRDENLKRAAILLFHENAERFVSGAYVKIGYFGNSDADLLYHDEIHGDLFTQVDKSLDLLLTKYSKIAIRYQGNQRIETYPVPPAALREALINAIVHKDYASGVSIQISVYENKLMIWNAGQLPEGWTAASLLDKHASKPFNPNLAKAFYQAGLIEKWGRGIEKIREECRKAEIPQPIFKYDGQGMWTEFSYSPTISTEYSKSDDTLQQSAALLMFRANAQRPLSNTTNTMPRYPAKNLDEVLDLFEPSDSIDNNLTFYIPRDEIGLQKLTHKLKRNMRFHGFLCAQVGSGKTTELLRLQADDKINSLYFPLMISIKSLMIDSVDLSHDALFVAIAAQLIEQTGAEQLDPKYRSELNHWGQALVASLIKDESIHAKIATKANAWVPYFNAQLKSRHMWKVDEKNRLEPKINDLVYLLNAMAQDVKNKTGKTLLVMIDDLEKGSTEGEKQMHHRLFSEYYNALTQLNFNVIYTLPLYFMASTNNRIDKESLFVLGAQRMYNQQDKKADRPPFDPSSTGYLFMTKFIQQRLDDGIELFETGVLDELIRIGGGLLRDTNAAIAEAAYFAIERDADQIAMQDAQKVFSGLKASYQPAIRGDAISILGKVVDSKGGWVNGVEPFLQSGMVIDYENGDVWLDVRYVLKAYVRSLLE